MWCPADSDCFVGCDCISAKPEGQKNWSLFGASSKIGPLINVSHAEMGRSAKFG